MPLAMATISGLLVNPVQAASSSTVTIEAATDGARMTYPGREIGGRYPVKIQKDGSASVTIPQTPQTGLLPAGAKWRLTIKGGGDTYTVPFTLTADTTWDTIIETFADPLTASVVQQVLGYRNDAVGAASAALLAQNAAQAAAATAVSISGIATPDASTATNLKNYTTPSASYLAIRDVLGQVSVKTFGAKGDNSTDDTAAITAAITDANARSFSGDYAPDVYFPAGVYLCHEIDLTSRHVKLRGDGANVTVLKYNGTGGAGTALTKCATNVGGALNSGGFHGLSLYGTSPSAAQCVNLYVKTGNTGHDLFFDMTDVHLIGCTGDGMDFGPGPIVNLHVDKLRVDGLGGWAFRMKGGSGTEHRPITISRFTADCGTYGVMKGLLRIDDGQGYYVHLRDGRLEGNSNLTAETVGSTTERSWLLNVNTLGGSYGAYWWLENVMGFTQAANTHAVVRDASGTNAIRGRADAVNFDNAQLFRADGRAGNNVAAISPQDMQTHFFTAG